MHLNLTKDKLDELTGSARSITDGTFTLICAGHWLIELVEFQECELDGKEVPIIYVVEMSEYDHRNYGFAEFFNAGSIQPNSFAGNDSLLDMYHYESREQYAFTTRDEAYMKYMNLMLEKNSV